MNPLYLVKVVLKPTGEFPIRPGRGVSRFQGLAKWLPMAPNLDNDTNSWEYFKKLLPLRRYF